MPKYTLEYLILMFITFVYMHIKFEISLKLEKWVGEEYLSYLSKDYFPLYHYLN